VACTPISARCSKAIVVRDHHVRQLTFKYRLPCLAAAVREGKAAEKGAVASAARQGTFPDFPIKQV